MPSQCAGGTVVDIQDGATRVAAVEAPHASNDTRQAEGSDQMIDPSIAGQPDELVDKQDDNAIVVMEGGEKQLAGSTTPRASHGPPPESPEPPQRTIETKDSMLDSLPDSIADLMVDSDDGESEPDAELLGMPEECRMRPDGSSNNSPTNSSALHSIPGPLCKRANPFSLV